MVRMGLNESTGNALNDLCLVLPIELQEILEGLGAFYRQLPTTVQQGLDADDERNRAYLGTYFPRSFCEAGFLWSELLASLPVRERFQRKTTLRMASLGSGTGGDVVGALYALLDEGLRPERVIIHSFDGNPDALHKQRRILEALRDRKVFPFELEFECRPFVWGFDTAAFRGSCAELRRTLPGGYDLVQASKWLVEFYNRARREHGNLETAQGIVREYLQLAESLVDANGLVALADVTTADCGQWFPMVINRESIDYLNAGGHLKVVSPIPCAMRQGDCPSGRHCYTRRLFAVSSRFCLMDKSQLCYRVFAPMDFAQHITSRYRDIPYRVNWSRKPVCFRGVRQENASIVASGFSAYVRQPEPVARPKPVNPFLSQRRF